MLSVIFAEQHLEEAALEVRRRSAAMTTDARFEYLSNWVLPGSDHAVLRLGLEFVPTDPAPPVSEAYAIHTWKDPASVATGESAIATGGYPVSPALDLMEAAVELGRLSEVRERILQAKVDGELQERCGLTLLLLNDLARGDFESACASLDDLGGRVRGGAKESFVARWPETLAVWAGLQHPQTREAASEILHVMLQDQVRSGYANGPDRWDRGVTAMAGRLRQLELWDTEGVAVGRFTAASALRNWSPVSRTTALTRGEGFPCTHWSRFPGGVEKLAGHNEDYLMYRIPLRGNFEVECDVSTVGWRDCHLSVAGVWVAPVYDHGAYSLGEFRSGRPSASLNPQMSEFGEWIRYRVVVRDRLCTTYFNGRAVHRESLPEEHDPWLAIRSPWYANSTVRGLRITGEPVIPEQIRISAFPDLTGWTAYYDETVASDGSDWSHSGDLEHGGGIVGRRNPLLAGTHQESLLRYQRPLLEDGTIEYEFYYGDDRFHVHPALDRRAFVLTPDGVRVHWISDGRYDRTSLDPANLNDEPECRRGPDRLPLKPNAWNRLRLVLTGKTADLFLNGQPVYRCPLEPTNQRTFGLFHFADRTEARVRNIVWTGNWPNEMPPVQEQELAGTGTDFLDERLKELTAVFQHDFRRDRLPGSLFLVVARHLEQEVRLTSDGLLVTSPSRDEYVPTFIAPKLKVHGDFDIVAEFDALSTAVSLGGSSGISLRSILDAPNEQSTIYRGFVRNPHPEGRQIMQSIFLRNTQEGPRLTFHDTTSEEATSGRLRLARRGEMVYCLFAEGDSSQFRIVTQGPLPNEGLLRDGVRLTAATQGKSGSTSVVWKSLTIRAEQINDVPDVN
ncbi:DUF1583 domain-containing protein [bacterium]|nr:DUF1583 domain-containing protein [bacterium]